MIFVTVGTHEQPFNRLIKAVDDLKADGTISVDETVLIQTGFSTYEPQHCSWTKFLSYEDIQRYMHDARIVVTHGGPSSFLTPLQIGKIPIVMPRKAEYDEHINNHQVDFVEAVANRFGNIIVVNEKPELALAITDYRKLSINVANHKLLNNNQIFCEQFNSIVEQLVSGGRR